MLFFHLFGLAIWLGSFIAMMVCVLGLRSGKLDAEIKQMLNRLQTRFTVVGNVGAFFMLISGFAMFTMSNHHALWVDLMAGLGGGICIFSLLAISIQSNLLSGRVKSNKFDSLMASQVGLFNISSWFVMIGIVVVLGIVSYQV